MRCLFGFRWIALVAFLGQLPAQPGWAGGEAEQRVLRYAGRGRNRRVSGIRFDAMAKALYDVRSERVMHRVGLKPEDGGSLSGVEKPFSWLSEGTHRILSCERRGTLLNEMANFLDGSRRGWIDLDAMVAHQSHQYADGELEREALDGRWSRGTRAATYEAHRAKSEARLRLMIEHLVWPLEQGTLDLGGRTLADLYGYLGPKAERQLEIALGRARGEKVRGYPWPVLQRMDEDYGVPFAKGDLFLLSRVHLFRDHEHYFTRRWRTSPEHTHLWTKADTVYPPSLNRLSRRGFKVRASYRGDPEAASLQRTILRREVFAALDAQKERELRDPRQRRRWLVMDDGAELLLAVNEWVAENPEFASRIVGIETTQQGLDRLGALGDDLRIPVVDVAGAWVKATLGSPVFGYAVTRSTFDYLAQLKRDYGIELPKKTAVVAGCGRMGRQIARLLRDAGYDVLILDPDKRARQRARRDRRAFGGALAYRQGFRTVAAPTEAALKDRYLFVNASPIGPLTSKQAGYLPDGAVLVNGGSPRVFDKLIGELRSDDAREEAEARQPEVSRFTHPAYETGMGRLSWALRHFRRTAGGKGLADERALDAELSRAAGFCVWRKLLRSIMTEPHLNEAIDRVAGLRPLLDRLLRADPTQRLGWFGDRPIGVMSSVRRGADHDERPVVLAAGKEAVPTRGPALHCYDDERDTFTTRLLGAKPRQNNGRVKRLLVARAGRVINFWASPKNPRAGQPTPLRHIEALMGLEDIAMRQGEKLYGVDPGIYGLDRDPQLDLVKLLKKGLRGSKPIVCPITNSERHDTLGSPVWR